MCIILVGEIVGGIEGKCMLIATCDNVFILVVVYSGLLK